MKETELGWHPFDHHGSARSDALLGGVEPRVAMQWHSYTTLPPEEAEVLASNGCGVQAFRYGQAWGFQFHPEGNQRTIEQWGAELLKQGGDPGRVEHLRQGDSLHGAAWRRYGSELFGRFLALSDPSV